MTELNDQAVHDAFVDAIDEALGDLAGTFDYDELKQLGDQRPDDHVAVTVERMFGGTARQGGKVSPSGWRITTRVVSRYAASNARERRARLHTGFKYARVVVAGKTSGPVQFEGETDIGPDDGWSSGLTTWTAVL